MQLSRSEGVYCKIGEDEVSPLAYHGRPKKRERKGAFMRKSVELFDILERYFGRRYFENLLEGKEGKKKEKGKEIIKEKIFSQT